MYETCEIIAHGLWFFSEYFAVVLFFQLHISRSLTVHCSHRTTVTVIRSDSFFFFDVCWVFGMHDTSGMDCAHHRPMEMFTVLYIQIILSQTFIHIV